MKWFDPVFRFFESWVDPFAPRESYEPPNGFFPYLWFYVSQLKWIFVTVFVFGLFNALIEATIFSFVGDLVDMLAEFEGRRDNGWSGFWNQHGTTLIWMVFIVAIARVAVVAVGALLEEQVVVPGFFTMMRWQGHKHVLQQSLSFFQNDLSGRVAQKVFQSGNAGGDLMLAIIQTGGFITAYATTTLAMVSILDGWLGLLVILWMAGFGLLARYFIPRIRANGKNLAEAMSRTTGRLVDGYSNIATVKLHAAADAEEGFTKEALIKQFQAMKQFSRNLTGVRVSLSFLSNLMILLIAWQALSLWFSQSISTGQVAFILALVLRLNLLLNRFMGILNGIFRMVGTVQNSMELIAQPIELIDAPNAKPLLVSKRKLEFENVRFRYGKGTEVIQDFNLTIKPGERVGLVGKSGAGKTTVINLLLRFFDVEEGAIKIDGQDVREVTQDSLRAQFGMVAQETALFERSVFENISFGRPDATMEDVENAARRAQAHEFILPLEDGKGRKGYEAHVGERGVKLSGGQRQRIAIARVMLHDAPILLLDEATSALDSEVEAAIQENLYDLMDGKTVIAIAHRLSTIASLDRLVVMDNGRVIEEGTHEALLAKGGLYSELWKRQSGGFLPTENERV